jgi:nucleoside-diphosphate-sugar epimerase
MNNKKSVLVTGAGGYIGSVLCEALLAHGYAVIAFDRWFFGTQTHASFESNPDYRRVRGDIRELSAENVSGVHAVCDLAALSNDPAGALNAAWTRGINNEGRQHVARTAKAAGVQRYVLASSCSVYGGGAESVLTEKSPTSPITAYAQANLDAEAAILPMASAQFCPVALRQATVFGVSPRMRFDLVINLMTLNAVEKGKIFVTGGGRQWRPLVHVRDTAQAFIAAIEADASKVAGEIINIGHSNMQVLGIAYLVRETLPFMIDMQVVPDDADRRDYMVDFSKAKALLEWQPTRSPGDGVRDVYEALRAGRISSAPSTFTVEWYKRLIEAKRLVDEVMPHGRLF